MAAHGCFAGCIGSFEALHPTSDAIDEVMVLESICDSRSFQVVANPSAAHIRDSDGSTDIRWHNEAQQRLSVLLSAVGASDTADLLAYHILVDVQISEPPLTAKFLPNNSASAPETSTAATHPTRPHAALAPTVVDPTDDGRYPLFLSFDWIERSTHRVGDDPPASLHLKRFASSDASSTASQRMMPVLYLPPASLVVVPIAAYPATQAPLMSISAPWLTSEAASALEAQLVKQWQDSGQSACVFQMLEWLKQDAFSFLSSAPECAHLWEDVTLGSPDAKWLHATNTPGFILKIQQQSACIRMLKIRDRPHATTCCAFHAPSACSAMQCAMACMDTNTEMSREKWYSTEHSCSICLGSKLGPDVLQIHSCSHSFCKECLRGYAEDLMQTGTVLSLACPQCGDAFYLDQLREVFGFALLDRFMRFETLWLKAISEGTSEMACPRCKGIMIREDSGYLKEITYISRRARHTFTVADSHRDIAFCQTCLHSMCMDCGNAWHAPLPCCKRVTNPDEILTHAEKFGLDQPALDRLERIFTEPGATLPGGTPAYDDLKRKLAVDMASAFGGDVDPYAAQNIIGLDFDLFASEKVWAMAAKRFGSNVMDAVKAGVWMAQHTRPCPKCKVRVEKIDGCNKMTCERCHSYFCWLCARTIPGYEHFGPGHELFSPAGAEGTPISERELLETMKWLAP